MHGTLGVTAAPASLAAGRESVSADQKTWHYFECRSRQRTFLEESSTHPRGRLGESSPGGSSLFAKA
jgi:hypothetical protein